MSETELPRYPILLTAYEVGVLQSVIWDSRGKSKLEPVMDQLVALLQRFYDDAQVQITLLPDGKVKLTDRYGNTVIRERYGWEK